MRNTLFLLMIVVMSVALAAAQHNPSMPSSDQSNQNPGGRATSPDTQNGPATAPGMPSGQATSPAAPAAGDSKVIEGCLGGSAPNFTVTDQAGTKYSLDIPKDADTTPLTSHLGQAVKVKGVVSGEKASASASSGAASASASPKIQVEQMARGTMTCPAGANSPSSTNPPSSK
jgi:hypothetical protein